MKLNELSTEIGELDPDARVVRRKHRKRVGRGIGSGKGKTAGRGQKGQKSRAGASIKGFEGGQMPLHRRLPKRGFKPIFKQNLDTLNVETLSALVDKGVLTTSTIVTEEILEQIGLCKKGHVVKILGKGDLQYPLLLYVGKASDSAKEKIRNAGGKITTYIKDRISLSTKQIIEGQELLVFGHMDDKEKLDGHSYYYNVYLGQEKERITFGLGVTLVDPEDTFWKKVGLGCYFRFAARNVDAEPRIYTINDVLEQHAKLGGDALPIELMSGRIVGDDPEILVDIFAYGRPVHNSVTKVPPMRPTFR